MKMDERGNLMIEAAIVLTIVLLISAIALASFEKTSQKIIATQENENIEILTAEIADNLINNPGVPSDWFEREKGTPGLAIVNEDGETIPNSISYSKFLSLGKNYKKLVTEKLFKSKIKSSMELLPKKSSVSSVKIGSNEDANDVWSVTRMVKCDFYNSHVIKDFQSDGKCSRNHNQKSHDCNYFKIFRANLKASDFYLLFDADEKYHLKYIVDTTRHSKENWKTLTSDKVLLNDEINFYNDTDAVAFIHLDKPKAKALLISVPKDFDRNKLSYDYFKTNDCQFVLKAWY